MRTLVMVLALALAGCSSYRADPENVRAVPEDRLLGYQQPLEQGAQVVVNRDLGVMGGGCYVAIEVDRQVAARIAVGEKAHFQVPSGTRVVGITLDKADDTLCSMGRLRREVAVALEPGEVHHLRIVSLNVGGFDLIDDVP